MVYSLYSAIHCYVFLSALQKLNIKKLTVVRDIKNDDGKITLIEDSEFLDLHDVESKDEVLSFYMDEMSRYFGDGMSSNMMSVSSVINDLILSTGVSLIEMSGKIELALNIPVVGSNISTITIGSKISKKERYQEVSEDAIRMILVPEISRAINSALIEMSEDQQDSIHKDDVNNYCDFMLGLSNQGHLDNINAFQLSIMTTSTNDVFNSAVDIMNIHLSNATLKIGNQLQRNHFRLLNKFHSESSDAIRIGFVRTSKNKSDCFVSKVETRELVGVCLTDAEVFQYVDISCLLGNMPLNIKNESGLDLISERCTEGFLDNLKGSQYKTVKDLVDYLLSIQYKPSKVLFDVSSASANQWF